MPLGPSHAAALLAAAPDAEPLGSTASRHRTRASTSRHTPRASFSAKDPSPTFGASDAAGWDAADAILVDLGVSSMQLDDPARGFSFRRTGPLDMRMGPGAARTAGDVVNAWDERDLARILREHGEEPRARAIARAIVRARPLDSTSALADLVARVAGRGKPGHHPATRTFQAIRIAVNDELAALDRLLEDGWRWLRPGGRLAILAYHSLEDRRVKTAFRRWAADCICPPHVVRCICGWRPTVRLVTPRALRPDDDEMARNPRSRSARLRLVERLES
jgi:16S rRNA (cytosine1402-N4)-methyltransferase